MASYQHVSIREHDDLIVVHFKEHPTLDGWTSKEIGDELCDIAGRADCHNLLLNFSDVKWLASTVLGKLVKVHRIMESKGGKLTLCGVGPGIREMFAVTRLDQLFNVGSNEADATPPPLAEVLSRLPQEATLPLGLWPVGKEAQNVDVTALNSPIARVFPPPLSLLAAAHAARGDAHELLSWALS